MHVTIENLQVGFHKAELNLIETGIENVFSKFDKLTLRELIEKRKYVHLQATCEQYYSHLFDLPVGIALWQLKQQDDPFYKQFLNNYGDLTYSRFVVKGNASLLQKSGVYTIVVNNELTFCGICARTFKERFNQHLGNISAKGCYKDGTATHCHINARLTEQITHSKIHFFVCPCEVEQEMNVIKAAIVNRFEPVWNIRSQREGLQFKYSY